MGNRNLPTSMDELELRLQQKERELYSIQRIGKALSSTLKLDELLMLIMQEITELMKADRSTLFLVDHETNEIWSKIALKAEIKEIRLPLGKGIAGFVAESGTTINIPDAYKDDRFDPSTDARTGYRTRSILCMPIWEPQVTDSQSARVLGVIQVLNKEGGAFSWEDEALMDALGSQVAISIANSRLYDRLEKKYREMDLLYDFEQLLNSAHQLSGMVQNLLGRTVRHLDARAVVAIYPASDGYRYVAADNQQFTSGSSSASMPLGLMDFMHKPSLTQLAGVWPDLQQQLQLQGEVDLEAGARLFAPIAIDKERRGILFAIGVKTGRMSRFEDERRMIDMVAQKISRAEELHNLRETLFKRERLSAIGQLMSTVVHDIRGPVNTIYGFVDLMSDSEASLEERADYGNIIREEIRSVTNMISEVLDFAKGKTSILPRKSSVPDLLRRFRPRLEQMCQNGKVRLHIESQSSQIVYVDEEKLMRVFYNISKNGLEAMDYQGDFIWRISDNSQTVTFSFIDHGPGIPLEIQDRLFESFVTSGKEKGTGLGLAIVKKIVEEHHGSIEIDSRPGNGAAFHIQLPVYNR